MEEIEPFGFELNELTTEWLTKWMRRKGWLTEEQRVEEFSCERCGEGYGFTTLVAALSFVFSAPVNEEVPRRVIIKLPKITKGVAINDLYIQYAHREYQFYQYYKTNTPPMRIPRYHYGYFQSNGHFVLIMEDLRDKSGKNGDQVIGLEFDQAREIVRNLAKFHASWWNSPLLKELDWIRSGISSLAFSSCMFVVCWPSFLIDYSLYSRGVSENIREVGEYLMNELLNYSTHHYAQPNSHRTLCHGDFRLDNLYLFHPPSDHSPSDRSPSDNNTPSDHSPSHSPSDHSPSHSPSDRPNNAPSEGGFCAFDFQVAHGGSGAEDLAYLMCTSMGAKEREEWEDELLSEYFETLREGGVEGYTMEELREEYKEMVVVNIAVPLFIAHHQIAQSAKRNPNAKFEPANRTERLFTTWLERTIDAIDSLVPNARDFLDRRWRHVQRLDDRWDGIDRDLKGVLMMAERFEMEFDDDVAVADYRADELAHFLRDFYPLHRVGAIVDHFEIDPSDRSFDLHFQLLLPVDFEGESIEAINLFIGDNRFVRGVIETENVTRHFLSATLRHPLLSIAYPLSSSPSQSLYPFPVDRLVAAIRWLRSANGLAWLRRALSSPSSPSSLPVDFRLNIIGHGAGANIAYSLLVRSLTSENFDLKVDRAVFISGAFNPSCDDFSFHQLGDLIPNWRARSWRALWRAYLPPSISLADAAAIADLSPSALPPSLAAKFPHCLIIYTAFDPHRTSNENFVRLLREVGVSVVDQLIDGAVPQVFSPHYHKGLLIFDQIRSFLTQ